MNTINRLLFKKIDADNTSAFRILLGLILMYDMLYMLKNNFVYQCLTGPEILFKYPYFEFVQPLSKGAMEGLHFVMILLVALILIGFLVRWSFAFFLIIFSYFFLHDTTLYNNHIYLFALIAFLMTFITSDEKYSLKNVLKKEKKEPAMIAQWNLWILRFQVFVVYFFGGLAKLNTDWLEGNIALKFLENANFPVDWQTLPVAKFIAISGTIFDFTIPFLLLFKRTRIIGILAVVVFNLTNNSVLFDDIGVFPTFMVFSLVLFIEPGTISAFFARFKGQAASPKSKKGKKKKSAKSLIPIPAWNGKSAIITGLISVLVLIQVLMPLRHYFMTDNPEWTGVGQRFAWRMKMQVHKPTILDMKITDQNTGNQADIEMKSYLTLNQQAHFFDDPRNMIQLAKHVQKDALKQGFQVPVINSKTKITFNGHAEQYVVYPDVDLCSIDARSNDVEHWVYPLE